MLFVQSTPKRQTMHMIALKHAPTFCSKPTPPSITQAEHYMASQSALRTFTCKHGEFLSKYSRIHTTVVRRVVRNLGVPTPYNLTRRRHKTKITDVDLDDRTLREDAELSVERVVGVLLDRDDG